MKKKPLRVVVVGAGFFGTKRLAACLALPNDFQVIGVVDPVEKQRGRIAKQFGVQVTPNLKSLTQKADLAVIATPNAFHADMSIEAMKISSEEKQKILGGNVQRLLKLKS